MQSSLQSKNSKTMTTAKEIIDLMLEMKNDNQKQILTRFFKTGKGEYGEGDKFIGMKVPQTRAVVKEAHLETPLEEIEKLLLSEWHEVRLCGLLLLAEEMKVALPKPTMKQSTKSIYDTDVSKARRRKTIVDFYLQYTHQVNNWDLVDLSCGAIIGEWLLYPLEDGSMPSHEILDTLAKSKNLWEQRIAIVSTISLIRNFQYDDTLRIATRLLSHPHDLIHKAVGWMLREVGKRDIDTLRSFLLQYHHVMPRTTLRYAIERMEASERMHWMKKK